MIYKIFRRLSSNPTKLTVKRPMPSSKKPPLTPGMREFLDQETFPTHFANAMTFTPESLTQQVDSSIEGFFAKLTRRRLKHGVFHSIVDLQATINRFLAEHNRSPKPFVWRADPNTIIAARNRGFQTLESIH